MTVALLILIVLVTIRVMTSNITREEETLIYKHTQRLLKRERSEAMILCDISFTKKPIYFSTEKTAVHSSKSHVYIM